MHAHTHFVCNFVSLSLSLSFAQLKNIQWHAMILYSKLIKSGLYKLAFIQFRIQRTLEISDIKYKSIILIEEEN